MANALEQAIAGRPGWEMGEDGQATYAAPRTRARLWWWEEIGFWHWQIDATDGRRGTWNLDSGGHERVEVAIIDAEHQATIL